MGLFSPVGKVWLLKLDTPLMSFNLSSVFMASTPSPSPFVLRIQIFQRPTCLWSIVSDNLCITTLSKLLQITDIQLITPLRLMIWCGYLSKIATPLSESSTRFDWTFSKSSVKSPWLFLSMDTQLILCLLDENSEPGYHIHF